MSNQEVFFMLFGILCLVAGVFAGRTYNAILAFFQMKRRRKEYAYLETAHQHLLCKGPHSYDRIKLAMAPLPVGEYLVCTDCGFVSNGEGSFKLNAPAMEIYKNNLKLREKRIQVDLELNRRKQVLVDEVMNKLIRANIEKFDGDMQKNIPELQQFFRKTTLELESIYAGLKKDLDELERG